MQVDVSGLLTALGHQLFFPFRACGTQWALACGSWQTGVEPAGAAEVPSLVNYLGRIRQRGMQGWEAGEAVHSARVGLGLPLPQPAGHGFCLQPLGFRVPALPPPG